MTTVKTGDKIKLIRMTNDREGVPPGMTGRILQVTEGEFPILDVKWDNGLMVPIFPLLDGFLVLEETAELRHVDGCPHCGNRGSETLGLNLAGEVVSCDACGWKKPER